MMHRCSSSQANMVAPCYSCGYFHTSQTNCNSFSMLFHKPYEYDESCYSSSPSVDCTLSLGTPSTRFITENEKRSNNFCWDNIWQPHAIKHTPGLSPGKHKTQRQGSNIGSNNNGSDPLAPRRCANCNTTSTPLWRNGPRGPKSLCNACGIRFKKEERRATAAAANNGGGASPSVMDTQHIINSSWVHHSSQASQRMPCLSSFNIW